MNACPKRVQKLSLLKTRGNAQWGCWTVRMDWEEKVTVKILKVYGTVQILHWTLLTKTDS